MAMQPLELLARKTGAALPPGAMPFMPLLWRAAARLEDISIKKMASDPTLSSKCVMDCQKLLELPSVFTSIDHSLIPEACGLQVVYQGAEEAPRVSGTLPKYCCLPFAPAAMLSQGRIPVVLESTKRTVALATKQALVGVGISGPITLASYLWGTAEGQDETAIEEAARLITVLAKELCTLRVDLIVLVEEEHHPISTELLRVSLMSAKSAVKICHYYETACALAIPDAGIIPEEALLKKAGFDAVCLPYLPSETGDEAFARLRSTDIALGLALPVHCLSDKGAGEFDDWMDVLERAINTHADLSMFVTTYEDLPYDVSMKRIKEVAETLSELRVTGS